MSDTIYHSLVLNMHQPHSNLEYLLTHNEWETNLWRLQNSESIELLGTAYYHPVMPLIPQADWKEQLGRWCETAHRQFFQREFQGF